MTPQPWSAEERAWAEECFRAGDSLGEIAGAADRDLLDVAKALGLDRPRPASQRWLPSPRPGERRGWPWVGWLLREVVVARCQAGEDPMTLAREAHVSRSRLYRVIAGICPLRPRRRKAMTEVNDEHGT